MKRYERIYARNVREVKRQAGVFTVITLYAKNPLDTGRSRSNWRAQVGSRPTDYDKGADLSYGAMHARAESEMAPVTADTPTFWVSNNTPYIETLESGSSTQAPRNWIKDTVRELLIRMNNSRLLKANGVHIV